MSCLKVERDGAVALLSMDRAEVSNALSTALRIELFEAFTTLGTDGITRGIVLTGAGDRAFSAGIDLKEAAAGVRGDPTKDPVRAIEQCPIPVIAAVNGVAITGGFELALACDILLASSNARFADTHGRVGIMPGWGLSQRLSRLIGVSRAKEMSFGGQFVDAATAERWGLVNSVHAPEDLLSVAMQLAHTIAGADRELIGAIKKVIDDGFGMPFAEAMAMERETSAAVNTALWQRKQTDAVATAQHIKD